MLQHSICKKCLHDNAGYSMSPDNEEGWCKGALVISCPKKLTGAPMSTNLFEEPPEWCPYELEHILKEATVSGKV